MKRIRMQVALGAALAAAAAADAQPGGRAESAAAAEPKVIKEIKLENAGFETGDFLPSGWEQSAQIDGVEYVYQKDAGHDSQRSVCIRKKAQRFFPVAAWTHTTPHDGTSRKLLVRAQVKAEGVRKAILDVSFKRAGGKWSHQWAAYIGPQTGVGNASEEPKPFNHDWTEYSGVVAIPPDAEELIIGLQMYGPGTVCFDDVRAAYVADETPASLYDNEGQPRRQ